MLGGDQFGQLVRMLFNQRFELEHNASLVQRVTSPGFERFLRIGDGCLSFVRRRQGDFCFAAGSGVKDGAVRPDCEATCWLPMYFKRP